MSLAATSVWHHLSVHDPRQDGTADPAVERSGPRLAGGPTPSEATREAADPASLLASSLHPRTVLKLLNKAADVLEQVQARCLGVETRAEEAAARSASEHAAAQRLIEAAEQRAARSRAQAEDLQARLAEAETVNMELRSRLVCLTGKLAASSDRLRYQTLSRALVDGPDRLPAASEAGAASLLEAVHP